MSHRETYRSLRDEAAQEPTERIVIPKSTQASGTCTTTGGQGNDSDGSSFSSWLSSVSRERIDVTSRTFGGRDGVGGETGQKLRPLAYDTWSETDTRGPSVLPSYEDYYATPERASMRGRLVSQPGSAFTTEGDYMIRTEMSGFDFYHFGREWGQAATSLYAATLNLFNATIGVGILSVPFCFRTLGIPLALAMIALTVYMTTYNMFLLHKMCMTSSQVSYGQITLKIAGPWMYLLVDILHVIQGLGVLTAYVIVMKEIVQSLVEGSSQENDIENILGPNYDLVFLAFICALELVLCSLPKLDRLKFTSFISTICYTVLSIVVIVDTIQNAELESTARYFQPVTSVDIFKTVPFLIFAFSSNHHYLPTYCELSQPVSDKTAMSLARYPLAFVTNLYILFGIVGFVRFGDKVSEDIADDFDVADTTNSTIQRALFIITIMFTYPIVFRSTIKPAQFFYRLSKKDSAMDYLKELKDSSAMILNASLPSKKFLICWSFIAIAISYALGISIRNINQTLLIVTASSVVPLNFVIPPYLYLKSITIWNPKDKLWHIAHCTIGLFIALWAVISAVL